ncbi:MAG: energy transducer TonB [Bacteroidetes bacterium]|nr:energy transducer TonB [Bacteroidota bacterium]
MSKDQFEQQQFEKQKNIKAGILTISVLSAFFLLFLLVSWTIPQIPPPLANEGIEVNLGNSETGFGDIPPQIPGAPSLAQETNSNPPPSQNSVAETQKEVAENNDRSSPAINTSANPSTKKNMNNENAVSNKKATAVPVKTPPSPPKPKAVYSGGSNKDNGGNNADSYNNVRNQGISGGTGDQGKPNGNPNSDNYTGNGGRGTAGININSGLSGRKISSSARFEDTYKYGGKVIVNVTVDANGNVVNVSINQGSPFKDINEIALKKARLLKFSKGSETQSGTVIIKFENPKG